MKATTALARPHDTRRTSRRRGITFTLATGLTVVALTLVSSPPAHGADYPSWSDVENARQSEATKSAEIGRITSLVATLQSDVATAQAVSAQKAAVYEKAQAAFDRATFTATTLKMQADAASATAHDSRAQAGRLATGLARTGASGDLATTIFLSGDGSTNLLKRLSTMSKLAERVDRIYVRAAADRNTATALTNQANMARQALAALNAAAERALQQAITASVNTQAKLAEQQTAHVVLQAQLTVLKENRAATEADFQKGEEVRRQQEAARRQQEAAARAPARTDNGQLSSQGWVRPVSGGISDYYGPRPNRPTSTSGAFHAGLDFAAGCGAPIYAATGGTVVTAGPMGNYGNFVLIDHGGGVQTAYAHTSRILVGAGNRVQAGQNIALVGNTGASTGCHLHFEVRVGGAAIDPQSFLSARGVSVG